MRSLILNCLIILCITAYSQQKEPTISFVNEEYDFGEIKEEDGKVTHSFEFTNTGALPLVIYDVKPTCGCTTPQWSKEPVQPGAKGFIDATFDPKRRPGKFNKGITVKSNSSNGLVVLRIKGDVIAKEKTIEDFYPYLSGSLRFKSSNFAFSKVIFNQQITKTFETVNISDQPIEISFKSVPKHLEITCEPNIIKPQEKATIKIVYDPVIKNDWDFVMDRIYILQNGKEVGKNRFNVSATIVEDFSSLSEEDLLNAPVIEFDHKSFDFGTIKQQSKVVHEYPFKNTGKTDLIIRKVKASCGCTAVEPSKNIIKPGESSYIKAIFNVGQRKDKQSKSITVITNDPINSKTVLRLKGLVEE